MSKASLLRSELRRQDAVVHDCLKLQCTLEAAGAGAFLESHTLIGHSGCFFLGFRLHETSRVPTFTGGPYISCCFVCSGLVRVSRKMLLQELPPPGSLDLLKRDNVQHAVKTMYRKRGGR